MKRTLKVLSEAVALIRDGDTIGLGGFNLQNKAMAAVREIVRQQKRDLTLICAAPASIDADLLIGAGCVREIIVQSLSLERFGPVGPAFRRYAEAGRVRVVDLDQGCVTAGLRAAAYGLDSLPARSAAGADFEAVSPDWFRSAQDPFTGRPIVAVRAMQPDFALVHGCVADDAGHVQGGGSDFNDRLLVTAARHVIATVERLVSQDEIRSAGHRTINWAHNTTAVCIEPKGAFPTAAHGAYSFDTDHLQIYARLARTEEGFAEYVDRFVKPSPTGVDTKGIPSGAMQ